MSAKTPIRTVFDGSNNATGLAEFQSGEFVALTHGGLGASLSIGSAGQVLKVNSGASALEFGNVEAVLNIDGMTDGTSITIVDGDLLAISDGGTEKRVTASQLKTYIGGYDGTIGTLDIDGGTDIGAALADADLFIVDDGAGGTNRKMAASRIKTYVADITLTTAAQTNITSLGTLTTLTVDNVIVNGTTIGHTDDTDLITLADGVLTVAGEVDAVSLDVSGDVDIDGTLEADAITIGGVTLAETISDTVGAMVTSNTETGVTVTYDDSDNTLDFVIGTLNQDTTGNAATATALANARTIHGVSFDGSANIDLTEVVQDTVGAMFSSNTETNITATYQDSDGTIDLVIGTLNQDTTGNAATATALETARTIAGQSFDGSANITIAATDLSDTDQALAQSSNVQFANLTLSGNLIVNGSTTTVNSTTVTIDDPIFTLGGDSAPSSDDSKDRGIEFRYHTGSAAKVGFFGFDDSTGKFTFIPDATNSSEVFSGTAGTIVATTFEGALTGNVTGNVSGTAATVTGAAQTNITSLGTLTALTVDEITIDGSTISDSNSMNITSGSSLSIDVDGAIILDAGSGANGIRIRDDGTELLRIHNSSSDVSIETKVQDKDLFIKGNDGGSTITALTLDMSGAGAATFNSTVTASGFVGDVTGNADTATTLANARTIAGQSFDGSANITIASTDLSNTSAITLLTASQTLTNKTLTTPTINGATFGAADVNFDSGTLFVDESTDRVGIGTTSPTQALTISGGNNAKIAFIGGGFQSIYYGDSGNATAGFVHYDHSSDNYQIDVSATITLDAPTSIKLSDSGTQFGQIEDSSNDFVISSVVSDKDLIFKGNDGGSTITALTLDMSNAGTATFGNKIILGANNKIELGNSGEHIVGDGTNLAINSTGKITLDADVDGIEFHDGGSKFASFSNSSGNAILAISQQDKDLTIIMNDGGSSINAVAFDASLGGNAFFNGTVTANAGLKADNITIDGTEIDLSSGDLTIDVDGGINLDADSNGIVNFKDGGSKYFVVQKSSSSAVLSVDATDGDMIFKGDDGGSVITALTLDMSDAGAATFNDKIIMGTNKEVQFVDTNESIKSDGSKLIIKSGGTTFNLPTADGSADQVLATDGSGTLSFADAGGASSGFSESTITTLPGQDGNFDLAKTNNTGDAETGLTSGGTDSFGVALGSVYTMMEPVGAAATNNTDLGSSESHVGA